jgi:Helix-turn-helix domain
MRQPDVATLQAVIAALPDDRLRPLLLELLGAPAAAPLASAPITPDAAATITPAAAPVKNRGGRPPGSRNKAKAVETGAAKAAALAALPGRAEMVAAVAAGKMAQAEAARQLNTTPKTVATWVKKFHREQEPAATSGSDQATAASSRPPGPVGESPAQRTARLAKHAAAQRARDAVRRRLRDEARAAQAAQLILPVGGNGNGEDAARLAISAARPAKPNETDLAAEAELAARLWQAAAALRPTTPWRAVAAEFGLNAALALNHCRAGTMPPVAPAAASRFIEASAS